MPTNEHGLSRYIPAEIKREVRRRSKHGCVFCRAMIYQYEHIAPDFAQAQSHDPENICLLCPRCHAEVTSGRISKHEVAVAYARIRSTENARAPNYQMTISGQIRLGLGTSTFECLADGFSVLEYDGRSILGVRYKEDQVFGGFYPAISGHICDNRGKPVLEIVDNEIMLVDTEPDIEAIGTTIRIREPSTDFDLKLTFEPPGGLRIDHLLMKFGEVEIDTRDDFGVIAPTLKGRRARCLLGQLNAKGCIAAISYNSDRSTWHANGISMVGGIGVILPFMGVILAKGAGAMTLPKFELAWV